MASIVGFVLSLLAGMFLLIALLPLLGWLNWITSLPVAVLAMIFSLLGVGGRLKGLAVAGATISGAVILIALFRLFLGGGIL
ncbi:MAG: hypothetical protein AB1898_00965 [Acidobacteriota bacterium]